MTRIHPMLNYWRGFVQQIRFYLAKQLPGKSTIIEALRYVLGCNSNFNEVVDAGSSKFDVIAKDIQQTNLVDTIIELIFETDRGEIHCLKATFDPKADAATQVFTIDGEPLSLSAEAIKANHPVRIYSWSEIESLGRHPDLQRDLMDRLIPNLPHFMAVRKRICGLLESNRASIIHQIQDLNNKRKENSGLISRFIEFRDDFERENQPDVAEKFADLDNARNHLAIIQALAERLKSLRSEINGIADLDANAIKVLMTEGRMELEEWWNTVIVPKLLIHEFSQTYQDSKSTIISAIDNRLATIHVLFGEHKILVDKAEGVLRESIKARPEDQLIAGRREQTKKRFENAARKRETYLSEYAAFTDLMKQRKKLVARLERVQRKISYVRAKSSDKLGSELSQFAGDDLSIAVNVTPGGNRRECVQFMRDSSGMLSREYFGQYRASLLAERCLSMASPTRIARAIMEQSRAILEAEGSDLNDAGVLTAQEADNLILILHPIYHDEGGSIDVVEEEKLNKILNLEEQPCDDEVRILLNGDPIDKKSPGQRCSALLPLLTLSERVPLIIDQPEDNLDNRIVGGTLTKILADLKEKRQIIVTTHNPNIVVGGDAEQVVVLDAPESRKAVILNSGSIDDPEIIASVISIMEGGKEAFLARERRYKPQLGS